LPEVIGCQHVDRGCGAPVAVPDTIGPVAVVVPAVCFEPRGEILGPAPDRLCTDERVGVLGEPRGRDIVFECIEIDHPSTDERPFAGEAVRKLAETPPEVALDGSSGQLDHDVATR
jgi:hypothetical protein